MKKLLFFLMTLMALSLSWGGAVKAQQNLPYSYGFEDYDLTVDGWTAQISSEYSGFRPDAAHGESDYGFCFAWNEQNGFLVSPELSGTGAGVILSFYYKEYSDEYGDEEFYVGYTTDENETNPSNFIYGEITTASLSWQQYEISLPAGTKRIAIQYVFNNAYYLFLDDFTFVAPAGCVGPASINVTALTNSSISIGWPAGNATSWNVYRNGTLTDDSPVSSNSYTFEDLTEYEVNYTIGVSAICGSEESNVTTTTVLLCVPAPTSVDGSGIAQVTFGGVEDQLSMYQSPYYYDHSSLIGEASPGETVNMSIVYATNYTYYTWVWVDWNQDHTFSDEECVYPSISTISSGTLELSFNVPATVASGNYRMRIQGADDNSKKDPCYTGTYSYLVDYTLHIGEASVCLAPAGLTATNVTHEEATLTWSNPNEGGSYIIKKVVGEEETVIDDNYTTTSYPITGLDPQTNYTYRVYIKCNASDISDPAEVSFSTTAQATVVGDYWSDDFEGTSCEWELINGNQTNAWVWGTATNNGGTHSLYISKDGGSTNTYSGASTKVFAAKLLNFTDSKYTFEYDWHCNGEDGWDFLRVALVPASATLTAGSDYSTIDDESLPDGWIALDGGSQLNLSTTWQNKSVAVNVTAGNYYLVLAWRNDVSAYDPPAAVDNVSITRIACEYLVEGVQVINSTVTTSTANVLWDASEATAWQVQTKAGDGEWTTLASSDVDFSLSGVKEIAYLRNLTPGTEYQVRVRANCGNEQYGTWSEVVGFTTECAPRAVTNDNKFTANFDDMTGSTYPSENNLPICWNYINTCGYFAYSLYPYVYSSSSESNSGANHLRFFSLASADYTYYNPKPQYAILPPMQDVSNLRIKFYARAYNIGTDYDATFKVGVLTNPNDASTFTEIATYTPATTTYELYTIPFNTYSGNGNYIAIMIDAAEVPASGDFHRMLFVDDITVEPTPTCVEPTGVTVAVNGPNSATVSWTDGGNTGTPTYIIRMGDTELDGSTTPAVSIEGTTATLTGLTADHNYAAGDFTISTKCSETESSEPVNVYAFNTPCDAITITENEKYNEYFDNYTTTATSTSAPSTYPNDKLPNCWRFINRSSTSSTYPAAFLTSYSSYAVSGNCLFLKSSKTTPLYAVLPEFENEISTLQLTFTYRNEGTSASNGTLYVGYMTDPTDASTFNNDNAIACARTTTKTEKEVSFANAPAGSYLAFKYQGGTSDNMYLSIDNVKVELAPTCWQPQNLASSNVTNESATLIWERHANGTETEWVLQYGTDNTFATSTTTVNVSDNPTYTIENGLEASSTYYVRVKPACDNDGNLWSETISFETEAACMIPNQLAISGVTAYEATLTWNGNDDHFIVERGSYDNTGTPVAVTVLNEGFEGGAMPEGWSTEGSNSWMVGAGSGHGSVVTTAATGSYNANFHSGNASGDGRLITPALNLSGASSATLSFKYTNPVWSGGRYALSIYYRVNGGEWNQIASTITDSHDEWTSSDEYALPGLASNYEICFYTTGYDNDYGHGIGIDSIVIEAMEYPIAWTVVDNNVPNNANAGTYTFENLDPETTYMARVTGNCGDETSVPSAPVIFTTLDDGPAQPVCHEWQLVTSANDLHDGDQIIIAASGNYNVAMSTTQKDNNRDVATIIKDGNKLTLPVGDDVQVLTANYLATNDAWTLYTGEGYLYAASSSSNLLRTEEEIDEYGNAYWTITFPNGVASIVANGNNSHNIMKYNNNSSIISCYASGQSPLAIYRLIDNRRLATKDTIVAHALPFTFTMAGQPDTIITSYGEFNLSYVIEADPVNCDSVLNVHLTVNEPMFTVTLNAGAGTITLPAQLTGNSTHSVDLANLVPELDNNCTEWTFAGWSSAAVAETNDAPDFVTTISPTSDTTLYAVYVKSEGGSGDATKVTSIAVDDVVALVCETAKVELSGVTTYGTTSSYSSLPSGTYPLTVVQGSGTGSYALKTSNNTYLSWSSGNTLATSNTVNNSSSWVISINSNGNADISNVGTTSRKLQYNSGSPRFACYTSSQTAVQFYKLPDPPLNTYNSNPVCDVNYNITLIQPADGSISSDPELTASAGAVVTLTATPHAGYTFESWEVRNLSTGLTVDVVNDQFTMPAANVEVHASFTAIEYTVTATANPAAGGTVSGAGTYSYEGVASLIASANNGYEFVNWTNEQGAVVCTTATYNFIVTRDSALTANFALKEYTITMSVVTGGTLSHTLPANVATMGTEVTLIATPDEGYQFDGDWTVQNTSASSPVEVVNNKFTMPAGNVTVTGYFSPITYTVSAVISPDNAGSVSGTGSYNHGAEAQLRATPASGYEFVNWTNAQGAVVSTDADYNFIVNRDSALTANFELKEYTITMSVVSGGTLSHNLPANVATMGTEVTLIATPDEGYQFDGDWYVQNTSASSPVTVENNKFTMPAGNVTVTGYFSYITYTVSAVVSPANAGSVTGTGSFNHGAEVQLTANPATGYEFVNWTNAQGAVVCTTATYNFNVTSDSALTANFALKEYTITYMDGNTELDVDTFAFGADVTAIADPEKECKEFAGWNETLPATMPANNIVLYAQWNDLYYNITASADPVNGGSVTFNPEPEVGTTAANSGYLCNTPVTLTATPAQGYTFTGWSVNGQIVSADAEYDIIATQNSTLVATYAPNKYNITWELNGGTYTGQAQLPTTYTYGEAYTLPTANELNKDNHTFGGWYDNAQFTGNPITEISTTAMGDTAFYAMWTTDAFAITLIQPSNGTISSDPAQTAAVGAQVILTATPNEGYSFDAWEVRNTTTGQTVDVVNNQFTMPAGNVEVHASFTLNSYDVIATVNPVDGGTITGAGTFSHGGVATLTATANEGYRFINWTSNQTEITTETSVAITVTSDTNLVANFQALEKVASPTFSPVAGTYTEPQTVTIACATPGAVIYYTTDGNEPTANSTQYTDGFELNANTTVKAIAMKDGNDWLPSDVTTAEYTFNFPTYTVTFEPGNNGTVAQATMTGNAFTQAVDFANNNAIPAADCQTLDWSFVGWSTEAVQETTTAPTTLVTSPYNPTGNITLYAVYQQDNNAEVSSTVDFSTMGYADGAVVGTVDINNNTTVTFGQGSNANNAPKYYSGGAAVRCYPKNTITISSQSAMTGITFTFGSGENQNAISANEGTYSNGVWTGNATSVVFTIGGSNGHRRIATITVNQNGAVTTYNSNPECIITYPVELATVQNGTIGADKTEAAEGETVTLNATPATGYHFGKWEVTKANTPTVETVEVTNNAFTMPASAVTVSADFWIDTLMILVTPNPTAGGTVTGEDEYEYGTQVTVTATPADNYYFTGWTSNGTLISPNATFMFTATQDSDLVANFEAKQLVATPTFTPAAGSYTEPQTVTIACATEGASIYYTIDGSEPTANSTPYTAGIALNTNTTVKAIAVKDGAEWLPSEVATADYTFNFPTYTVTFNPGNNGSVPQATMTGNQFTDAVDFTNNVPSPAAACTDWTFAGWSTTEVTETTTEPTFVTSPYNPSVDITLYAVYQKTEQGTGTATPARYVKVTSAPNDWSGDYLIVCEGIWVAFDGSRSSLDANNNTIDVVINNGVIDSTATTGAAKFTIASMNTTTGYYSIKSASGKYIGSTSTSKNELLSNTTTQYSNTISIDNGNAFIKGTSRYLRYNGTDDRFRYYTSSSQQDIQLYKYEPATATDVTVYNTNPVCSYMVYVDGNMQNGTVTVDPATATTEGAAIGSTVTLTATPATGYHFGRWNVTSLGTSTVESIEISANNTFVMPTNDVNVSADFWIDTLTIDVVAVPTVGGDVTGAGEYEYGTAVTLTATPSTYYIFTNWTVNDQPVSTDATITFNATQDSTFKANFTHMEKVASLVVDPVGGNFTSEDNVTITITCATPNSTIYYTLDGTDPVVPGGRNVTGTQIYSGPINITSTTTLKAVAAATDMINSDTVTETYRIVPMRYVNAWNTLNGTVSYDPAKDTAGATINVNAVANDGYHFASWHVFDFNGTDVTVTNNTFTMPDTNVYVDAIFEPDTFSVTFVLNDGHFVNGYTPISRYWYKQQDANLPTAADMEYEGHSFDGWYENANFEGNSWTSVPDTAKSNKTYYAKWNVNSYDLTINYVDANGQTLAPAHTETLQYGVSYNVSTPDVATYMPDQTVVSGNMGTAAVTVNVIYTQIVMNAVDNQTVCTGSTTTAVEFSLPTTLTQTFPNMEVMFEKNIDNTSIGIADETYGNIAAFTAVNVGTEPVVTTITVTPLCTLNNHAVRGVPQTFTITVTPKHTSEFSETVCDNYYWATADTTIVDEGSHDYVHVFANQYGCDSTVTLHLTLYKTPTSLTTTVTPNTSCVETAPNGAIAITAPTGDFEYSINGTDWQTTTEFANLAANDYSVYVRPLNSECAYTENVTVTDNVERPLSTPSVSKAFYCTDEDVTLSSTGSSTGSEFAYAWSGPNGFTSTETSPVLANPLTSAQSGTYVLAVTNTVTNCVTEASVDVVVNTPTTSDYLFTITTHGDAYANIDLNETTVTPVFATPEVHHFQDGANVNYTVVNNAAATYDAVGDYTITWTATDECGNEVTTTQVLHVTQNTCPVAADVDGNTYPAVQLAGKCWMAKNLRTTKYSDGRAVNNLMVYDNIMYPNTTENLDRYGYLYDWNAAMDAENGVTMDANNNIQGICPTGWHMPNGEDFMNIAGTSTVTDMFDLRYNHYWLDGGGNNSTDYSLLPGGCYNENAGRYENLIGNAYLWGVNAANPIQPRVYWADCKCYMWQVNDVTGGMGYSVRCIKD